MFGKAFLAAALLAGSAAVASPTPTPTPSPRALFGQDIGADYFLANYSQLEQLYKTIAATSDRAKLVDIGATAEGRPQYMMIVSSPENMRNLDRYRDIAARMARGEGLDDDQAHALAREGRAVVWIDGGMHAAESIHAQGLMASVYHFATSQDPAVKHILDNVVILFGHANPDGQELVANWYMRWPDPKSRPLYDTQGGALPRLYQKYIGHDNNRDYFAITQPETKNISRILFREWFPEIIYNHHQPGPEGMVVFMPPFRDPFNYHYDPLVVTQLDEIGGAMHSGLIAEGKAGSGMRSVANYSTWFNGSLRTVSYFHNAIGLLTEIVGSPTPFQLSLTAEKQLPRGDLPMPVAPRMWHLKDSIDYEISMNVGALTYAANNRERLLFNMYRMASNSVKAGNRDSWTITPARVAALEAAARAEGEEAGVRGLNPRGEAVGIDVALYDKVLHDPALRDPRGYILSSDQPDFPTAIKFANALIRSGVQVQRATAPFAAGGKRYPAGSLVVKTAQAYRPHILDMFEPQDHPMDLAYPGGPPVRPYDVAGYTLAYQMGVGFDRVLDGFDGPFETLADEAAPPAGRIVGTGRAGWIVDHRVNDAFVLTNRLLKARLPVYWLKQGTSAGGKSFAPGAIWIPASAAAAKIVGGAAGALGVDAYAVDARPAGDALAIRPVRIGLVDLWSGLMPSGWVRWLCEQFEFPYEIVRPQRLDAGHLERDYDVLIFPDASYIAEGHSSRNRRTIAQPKPEDIPAQYRTWLGSITAGKTLPQIERFARNGGTLMAIGSSTALVDLFKLPVTNALREADGKPVAPGKFYVPGSILKARVDTSQPLGYGMPATTDIFYDNSPVYRIAAGTPGAARVSWFEGGQLLRSGWAVGQERLDGTVGVADISVGRGKLLLYGPEVLQRGAAHGTFKLFFNGMLYGPAAVRAAK
ncbi:M14 metallopeptidase family protein [Sphingomonas sp. dw_22]|uniref:M14 family metallopeptidase n=1 Tax=Sphingomonas sp. dw_22 TaxID=2721175 RepID=UPI001BD3A2A8|nr:M14 metallopeptidase family protein [Sphingomonas sp. dw_22]